MKRFKILVACISVVSIAFGLRQSPAQSDQSVEQDYRQSFARFDQAYIPALALTKQEKADPSRAALRRLARRWEQLRPILADAMAEDSKWPKELETIDQAIRDAARQVHDGQIVEAHETLEVIRDLMMQARRRQNISYPLDALSDFHTVMEEIVKPAMKYTPDSITDEEIKRLDTLCRVADEKWTVAEGTEFDMNLFGLDPSRARSLRNFIGEERRAISNLHNALKKQDKQKIIKTARGLKPPFAKTYMFFGDFPQPAGPAGNR
jgi:hypothetical protein